MYGNEPNSWQDDLSGTGRLRMIVNAFTRMRMVDEQGRLDFSWKGPPGGQPPYLAPWFAALRKTAARLADRVRPLVGAGVFHHRSLHRAGFGLRVGRIAGRGPAGRPAAMRQRSLLLSASIPPFLCPAFLRGTHEPIHGARRPSRLAKACFASLRDRRSPCRRRPRRKAGIGKGLAVALVQVVGEADVGLDVDLLGANGGVDA